MAIFQKPLVSFSIYLNIKVLVVYPKIRANNFPWTLNDSINCVAAAKKKEIIALLEKENPILLEKNKGVFCSKILRHKLRNDFDKQDANKSCAYRAASYRKITAIGTFKLLNTAIFQTRMTLGTLRPVLRTISLPNHHEFMYWYIESHWNPGFRTGSLVQVKGMCQLWVTKCHFKIPKFWPKPNVKKTETFFGSINPGNLDKLFASFVFCFPKRSSSGLNKTVQKQLEC